MTTVLFSGSRDFDDEVAVLVALRAIAKQGANVIVGDARGLDEIVRRRCQEIGLPYVVHRANWREEGRAAGVLRNARMIAERPDRLIAFYGPSGETRGTKDCIDRARLAAIPTMIYRDATKTWDLTDALPVAVPA